jgi:hypothetical protein
MKALVLESAGALTSVNASRETLSRQCPGVARKSFIENGSIYDMNKFNLKQFPCQSNSFKQDF